MTSVAPNRSFAAIHDPGPGKPPLCAGEHGFVRERVALAAPGGFESPRRAPREMTA